MMDIETWDQKFGPTLSKTNMNLPSSKLNSIFKEFGAENIGTNKGKLVVISEDGSIAPVLGNPVQGVATLVGGAVTVNTPYVKAGSIILLTPQNSSGSAGELTISARVNGTSFTITSLSGTDTRQVGWIIFNP